VYDVINVLIDNTTTKITISAILAKDALYIITVDLKDIVNVATNKI
jgi:hypothetical protein